ncbi:MAG: preprotein translocase subunit YajC [Bacteroidota bacterium]
MFHTFAFILLDSAAGGAAAPSTWSTPLFFAGIIAIFYFFMIRPQQKRSKEEKQFREGLEKGDKVVTIGGIYGEVEKIDEKSVLVRVDNNTKLRFDKTALRAAPEASA